MEIIDFEFSTPVDYTQAIDCCKKALNEAEWKIEFIRSDETVDNENSLIGGKFKKWTFFGYATFDCVIRIDNHNKNSLIEMRFVTYDSPEMLEDVGSKVKGFIQLNLGLVKTNSKKKSSTNSPSSLTLSGELEKLADLLNKGILTEDEFKKAKNKLLNKK